MTSASPPFAYFLGEKEGMRGGAAPPIPPRRDLPDLLYGITKNPHIASLFLN
jgi:hypothetical protein